LLLREAKKLCDGCPVREECLEFAMEGNEQFGVYGGLSVRERRKERRRRGLVGLARKWTYSDELDAEIIYSRRARQGRPAQSTEVEPMESSSLDGQMPRSENPGHTGVSARPLDWGEAVQRGRRLVTTIGAAKWELGDLICSIAPVGRPGHSTGVLARVRQFAEEIGVNPESAMAYRQTAHLWPPETRQQTSWGVHQRLQARPDRFELLAALIEKGQVKVADVVELGVRPTPDLTVERIERRLDRLAHDLERVELAEADRKALALRASAIVHALRFRAHHDQARPLEAMAG
jgi:hypothetical protein